MRQEIKQPVKIPEGITCKIDNSKLICAKDDKTLTRNLNYPGITFKMEGDSIVLCCKKANKIQYKKIRTLQAHLENIFRGLQKQYIYKLEICHVHFPMTAKIEGDELLLTNFLGEKSPRKAKILPGVQVNVKGSEMTLTSHNKEAAGQTAANIEKTTKIKNRDRRIFQDGIFITEKPGREK